MIYRVWGFGLLVLGTWIVDPTPQSQAGTFDLGAGFVIRDLEDDRRVVIDPAVSSVVSLAFLSARCPACKREFPDIVALLDSLQGQDKWLLFLGNEPRGIGDRPLTFSRERSFGIGRVDPREIAAVGVTAVPQIMTIDFRLGRRVAVVGMSDQDAVREFVRSSNDLTNR